jgi:hypothetical protein
MAKKKKPQVPTRTPADKLLLDFIKDNRIVLIVDEVIVSQAVIPDTIYVNVKKPILKAFYRDQIKTEKAKNGEDKPKVDIVS